MLLTVDDIREKARRRLPRAVFDFIDGAADEEITLRRNREAFAEWSFSPRVLVNVSEIDLSTEVVGHHLDVPLILAPTGLCGMAASRPEILAGRAAKRSGVVFTASCLSAVRMEEIPGQTDRPWFQLYLWRDRALTMRLVERASQAGFSVLVVTVDVPVLGQRERDAKNGATIPPRITIRNLWDTARRPRWTFRFLRDAPFKFANVAESAVAHSGRPFALSQYINAQFDPTAVWSAIDWLRGIWPGPLVVKGIMSTEDASRAAAHGVDAIVVSNHGGRQLDGLPATLSVLPEIVDAVGSQLDVLVDGGVRTGSDAIKAIALGARACMIGRPYLYGLAADGEEGVVRVLQILKTEMARAMALLGRSSLAELDRTILRGQTPLKQALLSSPPRS